VSTKNWCCSLESNCLVHPGGNGRFSSSMLRRCAAGMPLRLSWEAGPSVEMRLLGWEDDVVACS
jgi:hypothetical protein